MAKVQIFVALTCIALNQTLERYAYAQSSPSNIINVKDYGVVYDGVTDNTAALRNAFAAAQKYLTAGTPVQVIFGPGNFSVAGTLSLDASKASVSIVGAGAGITNIIEHGTGDAIDILNSATSTTNIVGFSIARNASSSMGGNAISIDNRSGFQQTGKATVEDVTINNVSGDGGFVTGIALHSQSIPNLHNIKIFGGYKGANDDGSSGVIIDGYSASAFSINVKISDSTMQGQWAGIRIGNWTQGVFVNNADILGNTVGINWTPQTNTDTEYLTVSNSHINTSDFGIRVSNTDGLVSGCYFLAFKQGRVWHAVDAAGLANLSVVGNMFRTQSGLTNGDTGIYYSNGQWGNFSANTFDDFTTAIDLEGSAWATIGSNVYIYDSNSIVDNAKSQYTHIIN